MDDPARQTKLTLEPWLPVFSLATSHHWKMSVPPSATDQGNIHWSREETMVLIELYRQHPCLWNVKVDMYRDRDKRAAAMRQITEDMNRSGTTVTTSNVKRKIESLRNQHRRELRKMQK
ncbi:putative Alcohol dehydrogenase transcription factor Myb/SANT-like-containing protein 9 [Homarus americanus]|uniref:Putative Alcohol dehydrogenase transcription factor Myb/SANT-like-containing protein 9 n=1 Tax=Homarus americanus TaxID=6706 RepID=A0A8J5TJ49_HOMAM|nr:putative Alcohol dehydrogenase transcription factor Myb/SANT-like-containing protein 9 [Homarus americanus]